MWSETDVKRLQLAVSQRLDELRRGQDLRDWGGPSAGIVRAILRGEVNEGRQRSTWIKLDSGLAWERGSSERILEGGQPKPLQTREDPQVRPMSAAEPADLEAGAQALARVLSSLMARGEHEAAVRISEALRIVTDVAVLVNSESRQTPAIRD